MPKKKKGKNPPKPKYQMKAYVEATLIILEPESDEEQDQLDYLAQHHWPDNGVDVAIKVSPDSEVRTMH